MLSRIQPILKTGHGDDKKKVDAQMDSVSSCFGSEELLIFSDLDEKIRGHDAIDVLAYLPESHYNNTIFEMWREYVLQKEMQENGKLGTKEQVKKINGWALDKFKFLAMIERAWTVRPDREFYVFYETDTYLFWDNLFRLLQDYDPDSNLYMGSPSPGRRDPKRADQGTLFANGGPGYIISRGAMKTLLYRKPSLDGRYAETSLAARFSYLNHDEECCGDSVLGYVLWELGIPMQGLWPMFSPYTLAEIPFNEQHWCRPIISLHKAAPEDMVELFKWEFGERQRQRPILYSDLWKFNKPGSLPTRDNWDSGRFHVFEPPADNKIESFEQCGWACTRDASCLQWTWRGRDENKCVLSKSLQHGRTREPEANVDYGVERWTDFKSGWLEERIKAWKESQECKNIQWVGASIERIFRD